MDSINKTKSTIENVKKQTILNLQSILPPESPKHLQTNDLARYLCVRPGTIRRALCKNGHYSGIVPIKLNNGRLLWPVA
jgi:hypothetical protein